MFSCDLNRDHVEAKPDRVVSLIRSLNKIDLIPQDGGDGEPEPAEAFIVGVQRTPDQYELFAYLYHERTFTPRVYVWDGPKVTRASFADVEMQALNFIESMGFMMDNTQFRKLQPEERQSVFESVPVFASGGGSYRQELESKEDPSLLDLSDDIVDLEDNPEAFTEEEKKVVTTVNVDAFEAGVEEKRHSPFDDFEVDASAEGEDKPANPFDDFDSSAGSELADAPFGDDEPVMDLGTPAKPAPTAGGMVSELVEPPDEEAGALEALSGELDSALGDAGVEVEAVEVEDLGETAEMEDTGTAGEDMVDLEVEVPPSPPPAGEETTDFGALADEDTAAGGGADFGEFMPDEPDTGKTSPEATGDDDFMKLSGGDEFGELDAGLDGPDVAGGSDSLFGDGEDLAADLDKSLDDILSSPPAAASAGEPDGTEELIDEPSLGDSAGNEATAAGPAAEAGVDIDIEMPVAGQAPAVAAPVAASTPSLTAEERAGRLKAYGKLLATL
ncbi:MAG: hypothetical protein KIT79_12520 [Deltaproteobacteria bacterium]|nr:hypothetical protein [Deltaproteobacteria bacterium]